MYMTLAARLIWKQPAVPQHNFRLAATQERSNPGNGRDIPVLHVLLVGASDCSKKRETRLWQNKKKHLMEEKGKRTKEGNP